MRTHFSVTLTISRTQLICAAGGVYGIGLNTCTQGLRILYRPPAGYIAHMVADSTTKHHKSTTVITGKKHACIYGKYVK